MNKNYLSSQLWKCRIVFSSYLLSCLPMLQAGENAQTSIENRPYSELSAKASLPPAASYAVPGQILFPIDSSHEVEALQSTGEWQRDTSIPTGTQSILSQAENESSQGNDANGAEEESDQPPKTMFINFNNISIIEYLRFISRNINKNFIFDENDLQFNVTIISEEPATFENIMTALLQELRIHDLSLLEQGNNLIIHKNSKVNAVSQLVTPDETSASKSASEIITQVFKLNTADPQNVASIIKPLTSENALVEVLAGSNHIIVTDLKSNVTQIAKLIRSIDSPNSGLVIGQYVVRATSMELLVEMARSIIAPIVQEQPFTILPWEPSSSIFIVSTPFIVERTLSVLQHIDQHEKSTRIYDPRELIYHEGSAQDLPPAGVFFQNEPFEVNKGVQAGSFGGGFGAGAQFPGAAGAQGLPGIFPPGTVPGVGPGALPGKPSAGSGGTAGALPGEAGQAGAAGGAGGGTGTTSFFHGVPPPAPENVPSGLIFPTRTFPGGGVDLPDESGLPAVNIGASQGRWIQTQQGAWRLQLPQGVGTSKHAPPQGRWTLDKEGHWLYQPAPGPGFEPGVPQPITPAPGSPEWQLRQRAAEAGAGGARPGYNVVYPELAPLPSATGGTGPAAGLFPPPEQPPVAPRGKWVLQPSGDWAFELDAGESISVNRLSRPIQENAVIPLGAKKKSYFYLYKLRFRKGAAIQKTLFALADSLQRSEYPNELFIATIMSAQWLEASNSMVFAGSKENLDKMRGLMEQIDVPLRQVFIEMLILETSIDDSLQYGVNWQTRFGGSGDNWAGGQGFNSGGLTNINPLNNAMNATGGTTNGLPTVPQTVMSNPGFSLGVVGQTIVNNALGIEFNSMGALVQAIRTKTNADIVLNPKIITEDSVPAEIFVGDNIAFRTQSIANDQGSTITSNFEYRDIGTRLRVTPIIGENDLITLEISEERSSVIPGSLPAAVGQQSPGPNTHKSTTTTRVHLPDGYFLVISGMINDERDRIVQKVPCLGAIPIIGAAFKDKTYVDTRRNQMLFLRPQIIDTETKLQDLTKHQQDIWRYKKQETKDWVYETEEAFDWMNLRRSPNVETNPEFEDPFNM